MRSAGAGSAPGQEVDDGCEPRGARMRYIGPMEFTEYVASTTRARRYRDAHKTLRFRVYLALEAYVVASLALGLASAVVRSGAVPSLVHINLGLSLGAVVVRYGSVSMRKPWVLLARACEAVAAAGVLLVAERFLEIRMPSWELAGLVFAVRYWQIGEREVALSAYRNVWGHQREEQSMSKTGRTPGGRSGGE